MSASPYSDANNDSLHTGEVVGSIPTAPTTHAFDLAKDFPLLDAAYLVQKYETERKRTHSPRGVDVDDVRAPFAPLTGPERAALAAIIAATLILILTAKSIEPHPRVCVHPTEIPATWFGDCNRVGHNTSAQRYSR